MYDNNLYYRNQTTSDHGDGDKDDDEDDTEEDSDEDESQAEEENMEAGNSDPNEGMISKFQN